RPDAGLSLQQAGAGRSVDCVTDVTGAETAPQRCHAKMPSFREASVNRTLYLLAALVALGGCVDAKEAPQAPQPPEVSVVTVRKASVPVVTELPGRTSAYLVAQVRARVDGIVLKREFSEGADVKAGQRLYQIDPIYVDLTQTSVAGLQLRRDAASGQLKLNGPDQAKVTLTLEDGTKYPATGTLQFTDITVDPATGSVTVRAVFPNPDHVLLP